MKDDDEPTLSSLFSDRRPLTEPVKPLSAVTFKGVIEMAKAPPNYRGPHIMVSRDHLNRIKAYAATHGCSEYEAYFHTIMGKE